MPLAERVEGRDFRILAIKYFSGAFFRRVCASHWGGAAYLRPLMQTWRAGSPFTCPASGRCMLTSVRPFSIS